MALVGADGSGKSTLVREIRQWLSKKVDLRVFYMGSKKPRWRTKRLRSLLRRTRKLKAWFLRRGKGNSALGRLANNLNTAMQAIYFIGIAFDRASRHREGKRKAAQGTLVIYDRYPLADLHGIMDGPYIRMTFPENRGRLLGLLERWEQRIYDRIDPPDVVMLILVEPEVSLQRKPDHEEKVVRRKSQAVRELQPRGSRVVRIDGAPPREEVVLQVKSELWALL